jgi:hypothetical protein
MNVLMLHATAALAVVLAPIHELRAAGAEVGSAALTNAKCNNTPSQLRVHMQTESRKKNKRQSGCMLAPQFSDDPCLQNKTITRNNQGRDECLMETTMAIGGACSLGCGGGVCRGIRTDRIVTHQRALCDWKTGIDHIETNVRPIRLRIGIVESDGHMVQHEPVDGLDEQSVGQGRQQIRHHLPSKHE